MNDILALVLALGITFGAAAVGGIATARSLATWYVDLAKPSWNPPNAVFGPVWTALYIGMAVAAWLVWRERGSTDVTEALVLFGVQLVLNVLWSVVFFGLRSPSRAFAEIVVMWAVIAATLVEFARIAPLAGWLFAPYLAWVTFASALNLAVARLNPAEG